MTFEADIITAKKCPYCGGGTEYSDSSIVYGKSYGMIYICSPCNAYVGVHDGTNKPLGRLANHELREKKKIAHYYFDQLWKRKSKKDNIGKGKARRSAYKWLSNELELSMQNTHIGFFDVDMCDRVIELTKPYFIGRPITSPTPPEQ